MSDHGFDEDEYDDEPPGPSLAIPPLYVIRSADDCPECGQAVPLYLLGCAAFADAEDGGEPIEQFHFLRLIESVPEALTRLLHARCPAFFPDTEAEGLPSYWMNHCRCGAKLDDDFVCGDVGATFWPDTPEGFRRLKLVRLPVEVPVEVECTYMIGGGEYLAIDQAEAW